MSKRETDALVTQLKPIIFSGEVPSILVEWDARDSYANSLARDWINILNQADWLVVEDPGAHKLRPGVRLVDSGNNPRSELKLRRALKQAEVVFSLQEDHTRVRPRLQIGRRP